VQSCLCIQPLNQPGNLRIFLKNRAYAGYFRLEAISNNFPVRLLIKIFFDSVKYFQLTMAGAIVVVKKTFRYSNGFSYNHLYQPECFYEKRYKSTVGRFGGHRQIRLPYTV